jgi:hypothetical protein
VPQITRTARILVPRITRTARILVPRIIRTTRITWVLSLALVITFAGPRAQIIDRVLAVVVAEPITLSDVNAAMRFGFVSDAPGGQDRVRAALDTLIERRLQLIEVNRYLPPEPPAAEIEARLVPVQARFESPAAFEKAMTETGVTLAQLRSQVSDNLRIESYVRQRFGGSYQPGEDEVARYYASHETDFMRNGSLRPYEEVRDEARKRLLDERTATLVREWVAGLRRRTAITVLPK